MKRFTIFLILLFAAFSFSMKAQSDDSTTLSSEANLVKKVDPNGISGMIMFMDALNGGLKDLFMPGNANVIEKPPECMVKEIKIYPNPATDHINIELPDGSFDVSMLTKLGKKLFSYKYSGQNHIKILTYDHNPDLYIIHVYSNDTGNMWRKIVILR